MFQAKYGFSPLAMPGRHIQIVRSDSVCLSPDPA